MEFTGKQKAALLLMSLDPGTASELLKGVDQETIKDLAVELAYMDAAGFKNSGQSISLAKEFYNAIQGEQKFHIKSFLKQMLNSTIGADKAEELQIEIQNILLQRDPFIPILAAETQTLAGILENEHPQVIAVILSKLEPKKGSEILSILNEEKRKQAIGKMTEAQSLNNDAKKRIAETIRQRLETAKAGTSTVKASPETTLRKVAVILRNLSTDIRDGLISAIKEKDAEAVEMVTNLMITWEDLVLINDRQLQEVLRNIEASDLALAVQKSDESIIDKIKSNISERAAASMEEEAGLMAAPTKKDIEKSRENILKALRDLNQSGELNFIEED